MSIKNLNHPVINGDLVPIRVWASLDEVDTAAIRQLKAVARLPWVAHQVAAMPDVHVARAPPWVR